MDIHNENSALIRETTTVDNESRVHRDVAYERVVSEAVILAELFLQKRGEGYNFIPGKIGHMEQGEFYANLANALQAAFKADIDYENTHELYDDCLRMKVALATHAAISEEDGTLFWNSEIKSDHHPIDSLHGNILDQSFELLGRCACIIQEKAR